MADQYRNRTTTIQQFEFSNPVCKNTYRALPKIYGKKTKKKYLQNYKQKLKRLDHSIYRLFETNDLQDPVKEQQIKPKQLKKIQFNPELANPKINICSKINCACHDHKQIPKERIHSNASRWRKISLDKLEEQSQTKHKIFKPQYRFNLQTGAYVDSGVNISHRMAIESRIKTPHSGIRRSGLNAIVDYAKLSRLKTDYQLQSLQEKAKHIDRQSQSPYYRYIQNFKPRNATISHEQPSQHTKRHNKSESQTYSISSFTLKNEKISKTIFQQIKKKQQYSRMKIKSFSDQLANSLNTSINGIFLVPEEQQITEYMMKYQPLSSKTNLKELIKRQNFFLVRNDRQLYFGEVSQNKKHGFGINITPKEIFQGYYEHNSKLKGCQKRVDGLYKGDFLNGKRHGRGQFIWNNGQHFDGEWADGKKSGEGIWKSPNGDYYKGQWRQNCQNGQGYYIHPSSSTYKGQFKSFLKHGNGIEQFINGDKYIGSYQNGKPNGSGKYIWKNGDVYQGQFQNGIRQGHGILQKLNGQIYEGQFINDEKSGQGKQTYISGESFEGTFQLNQRFEGILTTKNGAQINITSN